MKPLRLWKKVRNLKKTEIFARREKALAYIRQNSYLKKKELVDYLIVEMGYAERTAYSLVEEIVKKNNEEVYQLVLTGKGLKEYLDEQDLKKQRAYEKKKLEEELDRPKFFF